MRKILEYNEEVHRYLDGILKIHRTKHSFDEEAKMDYVIKNMTESCNN